MKFTGAICIALVIVLVSSLDLTSAAVEEEIKVACVVTELIPCLESSIIGVHPYPECCVTLKAQQSCLCGYIQNPVYGGFFKNAHSVFTGCGVPYPTC
ncbi:hypothetical protein BRARA_I01526 [Brassica rapa]|uniref:Bifunctional inhibitor/plant lipid transfer protein/seed storage helical domain-containing protein n=3 Tax=Brassica TaxID=3705 RepID=A0A397XZG9_BRACM|nr:hypothetical protein IGI04_034471 [Brassica rapa subsp. trilocularis]RID44754.1 hypothetical protein BRARA_I01526 [Brassica rapa]CAF2040292.1 unnamed protein product [Brassica napus]CAG7861370.1 unnamed protein product [Brassica rapa]CDY12875.1 BnaA09g13990D [Brassica napus]